MKLRSGSYITVEYRTFKVLTHIPNIHAVFESWAEDKAVPTTSSFINYCLSKGYIEELPCLQLTLN